jgi:heterodisulfide reductase subunit A
LYGKDPRVMTQLELEGRGYEGVGGTVAMIQCVGSRDAAHRYCSRVCCVQAARNAKAVLGKTPGARVLIIYDQMVTPGLDERFYTEAREAGAIFARRDPGSAPEVKEGDGGKLEVSWRDAILGCEETVPADFVVLSAGIGADPANQALAGTLKVPVMEDGFLLEAHAKLRPVDFSSTGIFVAGMVHAPKGFNESVEQGVAAAGRAGVMLSGGRIRLGAMVVKADRERCAACLTCVRLCPYGAASLAADGFVSIDESKCEGCGMCAAACPGKVLELGRFRDDQIIGMLDGLRDARAGGRR